MERKEATQCDEETTSLAMPEFSIGETTKPYYKHRIFTVPKTKSVWRSLEPNQHRLSEFEMKIGRILKFEFPFYGHPSRNVKMLENGTILLGKLIFRKELSESQYIAPLSANFTSDQTVLLFGDNDHSATFTWMNAKFE